MGRYGPIYISFFWSHDFPVGNANGNANGNTNGNANGNTNGNTNGNANGNTNGNANGNTNGNTNGYCRALQSVTSQMPRNSTLPLVAPVLYPPSFDSCCPIG